MIDEKSSLVSRGGEERAGQSSPLHCVYRPRCLNFLGLTYIVSSQLPSQTRVKHESRSKTSRLEQSHGRQRVHRFTHVHSSQLLV